MNFPDNFGDLPRSFRADIKPNENVECLEKCPAVNAR
jgi:hypothetical protein